MLSLRSANGRVLHECGASEAGGFTLAGFRQSAFRPSGTGEVGGMNAQGGEAVLPELVSCRVVGMLLPEGGVGEVVGCCTLSGEIEGGVSEEIGCCTLSGQMEIGRAHV